MKKFCFIIFFPVLLALLLSSCNDEKVISAGTIINELAGSKYAGRLVGTEGNEKAGQYIADCFQRIGLEPLLGEGYFQVYQQKVADPADQQSEIEIVYRDGAKERLAFGDDYMIDPVAEDVALDLPITFGIPEGDPRKTVAVIPSEELKDMPLEARAVIAASDSISYTSVIPHPGRRIWVGVTKETMSRMREKDAVRVSITCKSALREYSARNVVGVLRGEDSTRAVVLTAHYDHAGKQGSWFFPGALDNASGTAAVIATAARIKAQLGDGKPGVDIIFAAVNSEECRDRSGTFPGSSALVAELSKRYDDLLNVNIDCVGGKNAGLLAIGATDERCAGIWQELRELFEKNTIGCSDVEYGAGGDHDSFVMVGFPAIVIEQLDLFPTVHSESDTADVVDGDAVDRIASSVAEYLLNRRADIFGLIKQADPDAGSEQADEGAYFDSLQWWRDAYAEKEKLLNGTPLKYNEVMRFVFDNTEITATGHRPLTGIEEARQYYPGMALPDSFVGYALDNIVIRETNLFPGLVRGERGENIDDSQKKRYEEPLDIGNVIQVTAEYRKGDVFLAVDIYGSVFMDASGGVVVREPLDQTDSGYFLNRMEYDEEGRYYGFTYRAGKWVIEVSTYRKTELEDTYEPNKMMLVPDYQTTMLSRQDVIALMEQLNIRDQADELLTGIGLAD